MDPAANGSMAIEVDRLSHAFRGRAALSQVSFAVAAGSLHGFVGPNGAGKTTTLKVLSTLLAPRAGTARVFGMDVRRDAADVRRRIGYMPDHFSMYRQMSVAEYLDFFAAAYGQSRAQRDKTVGDVLALTDMTGRRGDFIRGLSRGMQQRVSLARVLVHDPDLLLLDEPASGLDPRARIELMDILRELKRMGKTVFISSHILSELGDLCDSCTILDRGQVRFSGEMKDLLRGDRDGLAAYALTLVVADEAVAQAIRAVPGVSAVEADADSAGRYRIAFDRAACDGSAILAAALAAGGKVGDFREDVRHLNDAFMALTQAGVRA
ncbi:MAG TPA: ABC transporter ATP-binding protein [Planctomycetota bacterium]|nr:ABC transporter ATP-binding protein [Planctomycetota bacterium]